MDETKIAAAFNEWMRRYTEDPERYEREWQTVQQFLREDGTDEGPSYGARCARYLKQITAELEEVQQ